MSLVERAKNILLHPKQEWQVIDAESASTAALYTGFIVPLSAIGPVASLIGVSVFGLSVPFAGTIRVPFTSGLTSAVARYVLGLVAVYLLALIIDALAPTFGGQKNRLQALKVAAYSSTAAWVVGIVGLIPALNILGLLGLYSLYLLYLGLPSLMKAPQEKAMGYTVVVIICAIVLFFIVTAIGVRFMGMPSVTMPGT